MPFRFLNFFDQGVADGTLVGCSLPGQYAGRRPNAPNAANRSLNPFHDMLVRAQAYLDQGNTSRAVKQLKTALLCCDGLPKPPDYVGGTAAAELADLIEELIGEPERSI